MNISDTSVGSFRKLWKKRYGVELTESQARERGERLVRLMELVLKPDIYHPAKQKPP